MIKMYAKVLKSSKYLFKNCYKSYPFYQYQSLHPTIINYCHPQLPFCHDLKSQDDGTHLPHQGSQPKPKHSNIIIKGKDRTI